jgi:hypothetical protein
MSKRVIKLSQPAEKTIEVVFDEFLKEQQKRLKPSTMRKYEDIIDLFQSCLDGYAYQYLDKQESALFDRLYNAEGNEHREFCQVFGPEKIAGSGVPELLYDSQGYVRQGADAGGGYGDQEAGQMAQGKGIHQAGKFH